METIDYILLGGLALIVSGIVAWLIKKRKNGESGCGCGCIGCPSAHTCHSAKPMKTEEEKEKHAKMLDGITGMTCLNYDMMEAAHAIGEYQYMEVKDYKGCYEAVVRALNEAYTERNG